MGFPSCLENEIERRSESGAQIIHPFQYPQPNVRRVTSTAFTKRRRIADVPPVLTPEFMDFCRQVYITKYKKILSREMATTVESITF
jgi:hypothetical protein